MNFYDLWRHADSIPHLGGGGRSIGPTLAELASEVKREHCIVDIGPFLGSTTAYLLLGSASGKKASIYSYDRWEVNYAMSKKVFRKLGIKLKVGENLMNRWSENIAPMEVFVRAIPSMGDVYLSDESQMPGCPIGLLVDDCTSGTVALEALFSRFAPMLVVGAKVVMMDYYFYEARPDGKEFRQTVQWFKEAQQLFDGPERIKGARNTAAVFTYKGGWE